jgi:hypothetical protein
MSGKFFIYQFQVTASKAMINSKNLHRDIIINFYLPSDYLQERCDWSVSKKVVWNRFIFDI